MQRHSLCVVFSCSLLFCITEFRHGVRLRHKIDHVDTAEVRIENHRCGIREERGRVSPELLQVELFIRRIAALAGKITFESR